MSLEAYKKDVEARLAEMKAQLKWEMDNDVRFQQKRGDDKEWSDVTTVTQKRNEENIALYERIIEALDLRMEK